MELDYEKIELDEKVKDYMEGYFISSNFNNLTKALRFLDEDIMEIKEKVSEIEDKTEIEEKTAIIIYNQLELNKNPPRKDIGNIYYFRRKISDKSFVANKDLFYPAFLADKNKFSEIKKKIKAGVESRKINSDYLLEKAIKNEVTAVTKSEYEYALNTIYLHEIKYILKGRRLGEALEEELIKEACLKYVANPLYFDEVEDKIEELIEDYTGEPKTKIKEFDNGELFVSYMIVKDEKLASFMEKYIEESEEEPPEDSKYIFTYPSFMKTEMAFYVIACGDEEGFYERSDFSKVYVIKKNLIENSEGLSVDQNSELAKYFEGYIHKDFRNPILDLDKIETKEYNDFKIELFKNPKDGTIWHIFDVLDNQEDSNQNETGESETQVELSEEFLETLSKLNYTNEEGYEILKNVESESEVETLLNEKILEERGIAKTVLGKEELIDHLNEYFIKFILKSKEEEWPKVKEDMILKINDEDIKSSYDLEFEMEKIIKSDFEFNLLTAEMKALIDFRELDNSYLEKLAHFYLEEKDSMKEKIEKTDYAHESSLLAEILDKLFKKPLKQKPFLDEGKFLAPRWLVYPELSPYSIGWRMGAGEDYAMKAGPLYEGEYSNYEGKKYFPKPKSWSMDLKKPRDFPPLGLFWTKDGLPKYTEIGEDAMEVNDFITLDKIDEFQIDNRRFLSIEHAILSVKIIFSNEQYVRGESLNKLKRPIYLSNEENDEWEIYKYSVCLNASYLQFMQHEELRKKLLDTENRTLVYVSDDEWGGDNNLFGFALMELRDELRRLYEHEDKIDWEYTEYIKHKPAY